MRRRPARLLSPALPSLALLAALPACSITWRQPQIAPLNPVAVFPVDGASACDAAAAVLGSLELVVHEVMREGSACVLETDYRRLDAPGDPFDSLDGVAYVAGAALFSHGRYLLTATVRENADGNARIRLTTRIEGYDVGYETVRSNGTIEGEAFLRLESRLQAAPVDGGRR